MSDRPSGPPDLIAVPDRAPIERVAADAVGSGRLPDGRPHDAACFERDLRQVLGPVCAPAHLCRVLEAIPARTMQGGRAVRRAGFAPFLAAGWPRLGYSLAAGLAALLLGLNAGYYLQRALPVVPGDPALNNPRLAGLSGMEPDLHELAVLDYEMGFDTSWLMDTEK